MLIAQSKSKKFCTIVTEQIWPVLSEEEGVTDNILRMDKRAYFTSLYRGQKPKLLISLCNQ